MPLLNVSSNLKQVAYTSAVAGGIAYLGNRFWLQNTGTLTLPFIGRDVDAGLGIAATVALSAAIGEIGSTYVMPLIPQIQFLKGIEADVVAPALTGLATYGSVSMFGDAADAANIGAMNLFILGAASHLVARKGAMSLAYIF